MSINIYTEHLGLGDILVIHVPGVPIPQPRVNATNRGKHASVYTPDNGIAAFKAVTKLALRQVYGGPPIAKPLSVSCDFVFRRQSSKIWKTRPMPRYPHTGPKDGDNLLKGVYDALNGLLWDDDRWISKGDFSKEHAAGDEQPHVVIQVMLL